MKTCRFCFTLAAIVLFADGATQADVIRLKNSGQLRGQVTFEPTETEAVYRITLLSGAELEIEADQVTEFEKRPIKVEQYENLARHVADTLEAHWKLSEWCREELLEEQRAVHLERVLDFDPKHQKAHYGLGHTLQGGEWLTKEEYEESRRQEGYVKFNDKWVRAEQLESLQTKDSRNKAELEWFRKVRLWLTWATSSSKRQADGRANLRSIRDPDSIPALIQFLGKSEQADTRQLFIELIGRMGGERPVPALTTLGLRDDVRQLRDQAFDAIPKDQFEIAQELLIQELLDKNNVIVCRAGAAQRSAGNCGRYDFEKRRPTHRAQKAIADRYAQRLLPAGRQYGLADGGCLHRAAGSHRIWHRRSGQLLGPAAHTHDRHASCVGRYTRPDPALLPA